LKQLESAYTCEVKWVINNYVDINVKGKSKMAATYKLLANFVMSIYKKYFIAV
jgi:hypothetical protein